MNCFSAQEILARASTVEKEYVAIPEWSTDGTDKGVYVRVMNSGGRDIFEAQIRKSPNDRAGNRAIVMSLTACDQSGQLLFKPAQASELDRLEYPIVDRIVEAALRINGIGERQTVELKKSLVDQPENGNVLSSNSASTTE